MEFVFFYLQCDWQTAIFRAVFWGSPGLWKQRISHRSHLMFFIDKTVSTSNQNVCWSRSILSPIKSQGKRMPLKRTHHAFIARLFRHSPLNRCVGNEFISTNKTRLYWFQSKLELTNMWLAKMSEVSFLLSTYQCSKFIHSIILFISIQSWIHSL
jgi:hypothetical protein